jgi:hypothetical protein
MVKEKINRTLIGKRRRFQNSSDMDDVRYIENLCDCSNNGYLISDDGYAICTHCHKTWEIDAKDKPPKREKPIPWEES